MDPSWRKYEDMGGAHDTCAFIEKFGLNPFDKRYLLDKWVHVIIILGMTDEWQDAGKGRDSLLQVQDSTAKDWTESLLNLLFQ